MTQQSENQPCAVQPFRRVRIDSRTVQEKTGREWWRISWETEEDDEAHIEVRDTGFFLTKSPTNPTYYLYSSQIAPAGLSFQHHRMHPTAGKVGYVGGYYSIPAAMGWFENLVNRHPEAEWLRRACAPFGSLDPQSIEWFLHTLDNGPSE
jgi:hypothetical protein